MTLENYDFRKLYMTTKNYNYKNNDYKIIIDYKIMTDYKLMTFPK